MENEVPFRHAGSDLDSSRRGWTEPPVGFNKILKIFEGEQLKLSLILEIEISILEILGAWLLKRERILQLQID